MNLTNWDCLSHSCNLRISDSNNASVFFYELVGYFTIMVKSTEYIRAREEKLCAQLEGSCGRGNRAASH